MQTEGEKTAQFLSRLNGSEEEWGVAKAESVGEKGCAPRTPAE